MSECTCRTYIIGAIGERRGKKLYTGQEIERCPRHLEMEKEIEDVKARGMAIIEDYRRRETERDGQIVELKNLLKISDSRIDRIGEYLEANDLPILEPANFTISAIKLIEQLKTENARLNKKITDWAAKEGLLPS